jgi:diaminohydroxyphosphoribosylaminopyrimidine deaminase/5-amino-6-(5-phosphoribosylamino)uracil reductase
MHERFMRRCFELARQGTGRVSPNPLVGVVIVKNGKIIGEGFHERHGGAHAEPNAFRNASEDVTGATLYTNLEPCCHTKKLTPPCAPLVIEKKIAHVVICNLDPNPAVAGQGADQLRAAGIEVTTNVLEQEGEALNEIFFHRMRSGRPLVHLKSAATLDGKTALPSGESKWITGPEARSDGHRGRLAHDAVVVGAETIREDDPALTVRLPGFVPERMPFRVVLTRSGVLPRDAQVFSDEFRHRTLVVTGPVTKIEVLPPQQVVRLSILEPFPFEEFYRKLAEHGIHSLFLEGGAKLHSLFLQHKQVDRLSLYFAPKIMGVGRAMFSHHSDSMDDLTVLENSEILMLGPDIKLTARLSTH